jgi:hypothetical protein
VQWIELRKGALEVNHSDEGPADGLGDFTGYFVVEFESWCGRLGILEPENGFGGGSVLSGWCAFGGVGIYCGRRTR